MRTWIAVALGALVVAGAAVWFLLPDSGTEGTTDSLRASPATDDAQSGEDTGRPPVHFPGPGHGLVIVRDGTKVELLDRPGGRVVERLGPRTEFGSATVLSAIEKNERWIGVIAPQLGNGKVGWLRYASDEVRLETTRVSLRVDLSGRRIDVMRGDERVNAFTVSVGRLGTETPTGRYSVTDVITGDLGVYGCCAVALSARQPKLAPGWIGGDRIAIHGWYGPVGEAASGGCLRASNADMEELIDQVRLGVPVFVQA
jgi:L,D-transpeptidase catalytic domain